MHVGPCSCLWYDVTSLSSALSELTSSYVALPIEAASVRYLADAIVIHISGDIHLQVVRVDHIGWDSEGDEVGNICVCCDLLEGATADGLVAEHGLRALSGRDENCDVVADVSPMEGACSRRG
ncbi:hypothetical protein GCM10027413_22160 [Conyzicola nivalis]|uniref:Uncharacterized protein n=1 Tax=Conyzicola nivalis TaxID=1477021 RepID=A0A916WFP3_9MICO|nr:hypothetical protein GCM10010979_04460 [Conyzicola nivalis]